MNEYQDDNKIVDQNVYSNELDYPQRKSKFKMILIISGIIILISILVYLIFFTNIFVKKDIKKISETEDTSVEVEVKKPIEKVQKQNIGVTSLRLEDDDLDNDGVLDIEEERLGISNTEFDTDWDGISDKLEVEEYKTDPTKSDTDGDGFSDGYEITNGYNPLGSGKI
ncbi:MAG: hypothetical protein A2725_01455 [Candidatus Magasanikbacteria bacterium RIFCSPHIGHO2_01_FULL_33_34]|uniref:Uncharacterized protein n=1 Tax=Candidatus Magasanikbacteria bacterium RIFCSPHIGHO2_01_FULL_33_34 TaxID=1798671 RepID=A0A1F6LJK0_9BACT|nr:MAG: hypothetical protein A2725_01455 [Candidatus Magasanikbacteria bacterium RIFCSPHIGHO2_01_FULL_33_34]OGH65482.1 MAG: hypothetical protein A3B83_01210 [Candidatus Magasanikbacteria bacterium RIFCSPHIGHO2_02_FULL_33_17]OGH76192.1 MAG: hypothetical protein A3A89_02030 [Candidatus Magasanikbacteria bacterium RIFCSPLOWO2_01_FULL_33_34]OGH81946.1 MAG: hypothetical protein A3F93_01255 [Candidatus Magasanikbacteria bacterium RIFCSPLOWO2_12_FULL_34_7]